MATELGQQKGKKKVEKKKLMSECKFGYAEILKKKKEKRAKAKRR